MDHPIKSFNADVLSSYSKLKNFLNDPSIPNKITNKKHTHPSQSRIPIPVGAKLNQRWLVCQFLSLPVRGIVFLVVEIVRLPFSLAKIRSISKPLNNLSTRIQIGFRGLSEDPTKVFHLKNAHNRPHAKTKDITRLPPIPLSQIDPKLRSSLTIKTNQSSFSIEYKKGICRGISDYFLYLYLQTKSAFFNCPRDQMILLARRFAKGAKDYQPTLLQNLHEPVPLTFSIKVKTPYKIPLKISSSNTYTIEDSKSAQEMIDKLPLGAYKLGVPFHATVYIKIKEDLSYYFDPNRGVLEIQGKEQGKRVLDFCKRYLNVSDVSREDKTKWMSFIKTIRFQPVSLTS